MIHPNTRLQFIGDDTGFGVVATCFIPEGTITYAEDPLERVINEDEFLELSPDIRQKVETYSYRDQHGNRIVSWDHAKYVNHSCECNTISTGYGFEIAIRDIAAGEQITDEYALFNLEHEMTCHCGSDNCRGTIHPDDFCRLYKQWDSSIKQALSRLAKVQQPLMHLLESDIRELLDQFHDKPNLYKSVIDLKYCMPYTSGSMNDT